MNSYLSSITGNLQPFCSNLDAPKFAAENSDILRNAMSGGGISRFMASALWGSKSEEADDSVVFEKTLSAVLYPNLNEKPFYKETLENIKLIERLFHSPLQPNQSTLTDLKKTHELVQELAGLNALREQLVTQSGWVDKESV